MTLKIYNKVIINNTNTILRQDKKSQSGSQVKIAHELRYTKCIAAINSS